MRCDPAARVGGSYPRTAACQHKSPRNGALGVTAAGLGLEQWATWSRQNPNSDFALGKHYTVPVELAGTALQAYGIGKILMRPIGFVRGFLTPRVADPLLLSVGTYLVATEGQKALREGPMAQAKFIVSLAAGGAGALRGKGDFRLGEFAGAEWRGIVGNQLLGATRFTGRQLVRGVEVLTSSTIEPFIQYYVNRVFRPQLWIDYVIRTDRRLAGVRLSHHPHYDAAMDAAGEALIPSLYPPGEVGTRIGPSSRITTRELVDTIIHEELHHRVDQRRLRGNDPYPLADDAAWDAEELYVRRATARFLQFQNYLRSIGR